MTVTLDRVSSVAATVSRGDLADALRFVCGAIPKRPAVAIMAGVHVNITGDTVTLTGFDYEVSCRVAVPCSAGSDGVFLVSGHALAAIVGKPGPRVGGWVEMTVSEGMAYVTVDGGRFGLPTLQVADFPSLPDVSGFTAYATLTASDVAALVPVVLAAGKDDTLPILTAVAWDSTDGHLEFAATDRYRLARYVSTTVPTRGGTLLVPADVCRMIAARLVGDVTVTVSDGGAATAFVAFTDGTRHVTARLLEGDFPRYRSLWPATSAGSVTVDAKALVDAVKAVSTVLEKNAPVRFVRGGNVLQVEARNGEHREIAASRLVMAEYDGDVPDVIGFNPKYVADAVKAVGGRGPVTLHVTASNKSVVFTGSGAVRLLQMPVTLTA